MMRRGFTLIELSIVIVIVALIAGGIVGGRQVLENYRLNSVMTEASYYTSAIKLFQQKYASLPGDMPTATTTFVNTAGTALTGVANGDGGGTIVTTYTATPTEMYSAWIHLRYAELIQGNYTTSANWTLTPGTNIPLSKAIRGGGWAVLFVGYRSGDAEFYDGNYGHVLMNIRAGYSTSRNAGTLSSASQLMLDTKFDDGLAQTGNLRSTKNLAAGSGFQSACLTTDQYTITSTANACVPVILSGF